MQTSLPFAMDPVVYDFKINDDGSTAELLSGRRCGDARSLLRFGAAGFAAELRFVICRWGDESN